MSRATDLAIKCFVFADSAMGPRIFNEHLEEGADAMVHYFKATQSHRNLALVCLDADRAAIQQIAQQLMWSYKEQTKWQN